MNKNCKAVFQSKNPGVDHCQPDIRFSVVDDEQKFWGSSGFPQGVDELYFQVVV